MAKTLKKVVSFAAPIVGGILGGPPGAALGGAIGGAVGGGGLKGALIGGATGYAGSAIGDSLSGTLSQGLGKVGSTSIGAALSPKNAIGPFTLGDLGSTAANSIGNTVANTTISSGIGKFAGNSIADSLASSFMSPKEPSQQGFSDSNPLTPSAPEDQPFSPKQDPQLSLPGSLTGLSSLDPGQQSSNLATQGVYGGGLGPEEEAYFRNLINRRLVDQSGNVDQNMGDISPIENSYLSQMGFGGYSSNTSLLEQLSKYGQASA